MKARLEYIGDSTLWAKLNRLCTPLPEAAQSSQEVAQVPTSRRGAGPSPRSLGEGNTESETK